MIYYIASFPRSGNAWTRNLIANHFERISTSWHGKNDAGEIIDRLFSKENNSFTYQHAVLSPNNPDLDPDFIYYSPRRKLDEVYRTLNPGCKIILQNEHRRRELARSDEKFFVKTHEFPFDSFFPGEYVIQPIRNAGASLWSYYNFSRDVQKREVPLNEILQGKANCRHWGEYHQAWQGAAAQLGARYLCYYFEDMYDELTICKKLESFIGLPLQNTNFKPFAYYHQKRPQLARKGKAHGWEENYTEKQLKLLWREHGKVMTFHGYDNPMKPVQTPQPSHPTVKQSETGRPVFITGRFRTGSTMLWNMFRQLPEATAYYEPLHEQLLPFIRKKIEPQAEHYHVSSYFNEYRWHYDSFKLHDASFGTNRLYLEAEDQHPALNNYIASILTQVNDQHTAVLKFNRIDLRLGWVKAQFPEARILHIYRSPRDQWFSSLTGFEGNVDQDLDADPYLITTWSRDLFTLFPFLASPYLKHPYQRFYFLWKLSYLVGSRQADWSIAYEDILNDPENMVAKLLSFADLNTSENCQKANRIIEKSPQRRWIQDRKDEWFEEQEKICDALLDELGLSEQIGLIPLQEIIQHSPRYQEMLQDPQSNQWALENSAQLITKLSNELNEKEVAIQKINSDFQSKSQKVQILSASVIAYNGLVRDYTSQLAGKPKGTAGLQARGAKQKDRVARYSRMEKKTQAIIDDLQHQLAAKEKVIQGLSVYRRTSLHYWVSERIFPILFRIPVLKQILSGLLAIRRRLRSQLFTLEQHPPREINIPPKYCTVVSLPDQSELPIISVVTPSFNQAEFLERTMQSVLDQNYPALEYIVQDGGSTDQSLEILERFRDQLAWTISQPDNGQAHAINMGFKRSQGEIMSYLNSDDLLLPGALSYVAQYFKAHPEVDVIYSNRVIVDQNDKEIGQWVLPPHDSIAINYADYVPQETLFWRRSIWEKAGGKLNEALHFALDWDMILRFQKEGAKFKHITRPLAAFRVHPAQKTAMHIDDVGEQEMKYLREQYVGHPVEPEEINRHLRPYLRKSVRYQLLYRLGLLE